MEAREKKGGGGGGTKRTIGGNQSGMTIRSDGMDPDGGEGA